MMVHPDRFIVHNEFISEDRAADYFQRASVVVLPYIEASQSGVIPMAYSAAKPVVATTVGGLPEIVEDAAPATSWLPGMRPQLADAVTRLLLDAQLRRRLGENGKRKMEAECSPNVNRSKNTRHLPSSCRESCWTDSGSRFSGRDLQIKRRHD